MMRPARWSRWPVMLCLALGLLVWLAAIVSPPAAAHEVRPSYLEFREEAPGEFGVRAKAARNCVTCHDARHPTATPDGRLSTCQVIWTLLYLTYG